MTDTESAGNTASSAPAPEPGALGEDDVEVRFGANLTHLPIVRSVAANVAVRADFDMDAIADLRLAVDEACSTLITRAVAGSTMTCRFAIGDGELRFHGTVASADQEPPSTASFGWKVLTTLADSANTWLENGTPDTANGQVHVELTKRKPTLT
ncbi:hypothetical protein BJF85_07805 [Saccharomonospora sp. CUA-673]|uniref:ATP-binding protein n=1 Tax=Saccharomonospora sp. CUA-673 TaxID=1904969 RepID=UPI0009643584|nr:ATP-binding protein [Saccharomonospora sp. CUA-673]OLT39098.1 hypothetical protein BJF85_07805 [Saccharomonospora sp. CUA-673]